MTGTVLLLDLAGWVALPLWGIHMIRTGMQRAFGGDLRRVLAASLNHPVKAMLAGLGVTEDGLKPRRAPRMKPKSQPASACSTVSWSRRA